MNSNLQAHLTHRLVEADCLRTQLPNSPNNIQNELTVGARIVLRF